MPARELIVQALAPGVALTSVIFYATGLQNRFLYIASRARELNKEARELDPQINAPRMGSLRRQVEALTRRLEVVRQTILVCYGSLGMFIVSILLLLAEGALTPSGPDGAGNAMNALATLAFGLGFVGLGIATVLSSAEMLLSMRTLRDDVRSSFGEAVGNAVLRQAPELEEPKA